MLLHILLVIQILISIALIAVVLMQRSEGGLMTARGAGNLLTTATWWLGAMFAICAILLTIVGNMEGRTGSSFDAEDIGSAVGVPADPAAQPEQPTAPVAPAQDSLSLDSLPVGEGATSSGAPAQ